VAWRAFLLATTLLLAGCTHAADPEVAAHELRGKAAPDFSLAGLEGHPLSLADYRGKVVVVAFFATWCEPCKKTMPALDALRDKYAARGLSVVGVAEDDTPEGLSDYVAARGVDFPIAWDAAQAAVRPYYARNLPAEFVVGRDGVVRAAFIGYAEGVEVEIEREVLRLL
jgi:peroxiredoxin